MDIMAAGARPRESSFEEQDTEGVGRQNLHSLSANSTRFGDAASSAVRPCTHRRYYHQLPLQIGQRLTFLSITGPVAILRLGRVAGDAGPLADGTFVARLMASRARRFALVLVAAVLVWLHPPVWQGRE